jgi:MFS family permease
MLNNDKRLHRKNLWVTLWQPHYVVFGPVNTAQNPAMVLARQLTWALGLTQTLGWATTYYIPATMMAAAAEEFGVSRTVLLAGFSLALLVCGLCSPWVGRWIDRHGGRGVMALSAVVTALGLVVMALSGALWSWYAAWTIVGFGMAMGLYDACFATIARLLGTQARPVIVGVTLMGGLASTIGWPVGTFLVTHYGWRASVCAYAGLQLLVILPVTWLLVPRAEAGPLVPAPAAAGPPPPAGAFVLMAAYFTLRQAITAVISVHALVLLAGLGASTGQAVWAATLIGPAQVASRLIDWKFGRGFNPMVAAVTGTTLLPMGFLSLLLGWPYAVFGVVYGLSNGILTITRGTLPLHVFGAQGYGGRLGRIALPSMIASALAPTLLSPLIETVPAWEVVAALTGMGAVSLALILALRR